MTDPSASDRAPAELVALVLDQAPEIAALDGPRAEAWASDILALAVEMLDGDRPEAQLVAAVAAEEGDGAATALCALGAFGREIPEPRWEGAAPGWASAIGTSRCEDAWLLESWGAASAAFRFVDALDVRHVITADLIGGAPEQLGEVMIGPGELLGALDEEDADVEAVEVEPELLAGRVAAALAATGTPRESAVVNGRLLIARLASITGETLAPPVAGTIEVPEIPPRDPDDDAHALDVLDRAIGRASSFDPEGPAARVRELLADDVEVAAWVAAAGCSLDGPDVEVALAVVVATIAPQDLGPLEPTQRDAVLTLEWADWLGAVIGLIRKGAGAAVNGESMVDAVNRCPEVTSTIPKRDRARIAWAFDVLIRNWEALGLAADGDLTARGIDVLPAALRRAWAPS